MGLDVSLASPGTKACDAVGGAIRPQWRETGHRIKTISCQKLFHLTITLISLGWSRERGAGCCPCAWGNDRTLPPLAAAFRPAGHTARSSGPDGFPPQSMREAP